MMDTNQALNRIEAILAGHRMPAHVICIDGTIYVPIPISPMIEAEIKLATGDMPVIAPQDRVYALIAQVAALTAELDEARADVASADAGRGDEGE